MAPAECHLSRLSRLVDEKQAGEILGVAPGTLSVWRCVRRVDLPYVKIGKCVRYKMDDLERFIASHTVGAVTE